MMNKRVLNTVFLIRFDKWERCKDSFENRYLDFSCAANWLNYAIRQNNVFIGDYFEGVFAHIKRTDKRLDQLRDYGNNIIISPCSNKTILLRFMPTMLSPSLCLYNFNPREAKKRDAQTIIPINANSITREFGYDIESTGLLVIYDPYKFYKELIHQIPLSVRKNHDKLTEKAFVNKFDFANPFEMQDINYTIYDEHTMFFHNNIYGNELFWKLPRYKCQHEARVVIKNIYFNQAIDNNFEGYDYRKCSLRVQMPNLQEYSLLLKCDGIENFTVNFI